MADITCAMEQVHDVDESHNLAADPAHAATLALLQKRVAFHTGRMFDRDIDHTNVTTEGYCDIVKAGLWAEPFGFAPPAAPPPPPSPIGPALTAALTGIWVMHPPPHSELFAISVGADGTSIIVKTVNHTNCWSSLRGTAIGRVSDAKIELIGRERQCHNSPNVITGTLSGKQIVWGMWSPWERT